MRQREEETVEKTEQESTSNGLTEEKQEEREENEAQKSNEKQPTVIQKAESNKSVKTEQSESKPQIQEEQKQEQKPPATSNVQGQTPVPQVDEEYERLKKQVEYATYEECQKAGFEKAFADTVNILGFSCQEIIYKGEVLGYKLHLDYTNPMK